MPIRGGGINISGTSFPSLPVYFLVWSKGGSDLVPRRGRGNTPLPPPPRFLSALHPPYFQLTKTDPTLLSSSSSCLYCKLVFYCTCAEILEQSMGAMNRAGIPARQCWRFRTIHGGLEPSGNRVVVQVRQAS
jgi:hypothetical protein